MVSELFDCEVFGVCGQIIFWNFLLLMLVWKVVLVFVMGNIVVLKFVEYMFLMVIFFVDICCQVGLFKGVVNIVIGDGIVGEKIVIYEDIDKIVFIGFIFVGCKI